MSTTWAFSYLPLLPIAIPLVGAGLLVMLRSLLTPRRCAMAVALTAIASFIANCCCSKIPWTFSVLAIPFEGLSSLFGRSLAFSLNQWTRFGGLLLAGIVALSNLISLKHPTSRGGAVLSLLMLAAGHSFILSSNLFSLLICWGIMDLALLGLSGFHAIDLEDTDRTTRGIALLQIAWLPILTTSLLIRRDHPLSLTCQVLLVIVAWIRMGAYPAQMRALRHERVPVSEMIAAHGIPLVAGLYLLVRVVEQGVPYRGLFIAVSSAACLLTGFMAFQARDFRLALSYVTLNQASAALLILFTMGPAGAAVAWVTVAGTLLGVSCVGQTDYVFPASLGCWGRGPVLIASLSLIGLPLTTGFVSRWSVLQDAVGRGNVGLTLTLSLSGALLVVPLMKRAYLVWTRAIGNTADMGSAEWISFSATALLSMAILGLRVIPLALQHARGGGPESFANATPSPLLMILLGFIVPIVGGAILARSGPRLPEIAQRVMSATATVADMDWAYAALQLLARGITAPLRYVAHLVEEGIYLGWVLLWALVILLWLWGR